MGVYADLQEVTQTLADQLSAQGESALDWQSNGRV